MDIKALLESFQEFGTATYPVGPRTQVGMADPVPAEVFRGVDPGEDFPVELLALYPKSDGIEIIGDGADPDRTCLAIFPWNQFMEIDAMHESMGFVERFPGVYTIGTYGDYLVLVDTMNIHGKGKQAVFLVAKTQLMSPPETFLAPGVAALMLRAISGKPLA